MKITDPQIQRILRRGRHKAIIKDVAGRRMLIGFEPNSKDSRKYHQKLFTNPIDLDQLGKETKDKVEESAMDKLAKELVDKAAPPPPPEPKPAPVEPKLTAEDLEALERAEAKRARKLKRQ